jgi:hypothetical protein
VKRFVLILSLGIYAAESAAAVPPTRVDVSREAAVLTDPYASSARKYEAANALGGLGPAARDAIPALLRQTRYDMPPVRERAARALAQILVGGEREAAQRIAADRALDTLTIPEALRKPESIRGWEHLRVAARLLDSRDPAVRRAAITAIVRMRQAAAPEDPALLRLPRRERTSVAADLVRFGRYSAPELTLELLDVVDALAPDQPVIVPLLVDALTERHLDPADATRARAVLKPYVAKWLDKKGPPKPVVVRELVRAIRAGIGRRGTVARRLLDELGDAARPLAALGALAQTVRSPGEDMDAFVAEMGGNAPLTRLAAEAAALPDFGRRFDVERAIDDLAEGNVDALAAALTSRREHAPTVLIARIVAATEAAKIFGRTGGHPAEAALAASIRRGEALSPEVFAALDVDAVAVRQAAAPLIASKTARARLAAATALYRANPKDADARSAAAELVRDDAEDVRLAAAALSDDGRALDLARLPGWIADLRGDRPEARELAARKLATSGLLRADVAAALVRAVDRRDQAAREGLLRAIEQSIASGRPAKESLDAAAADPGADAATRAYARAGLRELTAGR